jgi:hypothetical protein
MFIGCRIPDSGIKKVLDPGSGSATLDFSFLYETIGFVRNFYNFPLGASMFTQPYNTFGNVLYMPICIDKVAKKMLL